MRIITDEFAKSIIPVRPQNAHKGLFGSLLNISGAVTMSGAAMMSTMSAMRVGVGITRLATPLDVATMVTPHLMEAMTFPLAQNDDGAILSCSHNTQKILLPLLKKSTACLIGCGLSVCDDTKRIVEFVINNTQCNNIVLDADAINCLSDNHEMNILKLMKASRSNNIILTPHVGEFARLINKSTDDVLKTPEALASEFAKKYKVILVLKGHETLICDKNGDIYKNIAGNCALAKGGSGDVLAGMIAGFLSQKEYISPLNAAIGGVYFHAKAADTLVKTYSDYSVLARDIIAQIPFELKSK